MKRFYIIFIVSNCISMVISAFSAVTLTRSKGLNSVSPKPSQPYRRLLKPVEETTAGNTPLDLFFAGEPQRRSDIDTIWKWDMWCQLQPMYGSGSNKMTAYYYDAQLDQCLMFGYSGVGGNQNRFHSTVECERHCKGTTYMTLKETSRTTFCGLQPNAGLCLALINRYYYDVNSKQCTSFVYGGCGGNQNRFTTPDECYDRCGNSENE